MPEDFLQRTQYEKYLQNNVLGDKLSIINETVISSVNKIQEELSYSLKNYADAAIAESERLNETLTIGFLTINYNLEHVQRMIWDLSERIGHGIETVVEVLKVTHWYLGQIHDALYIPEDEKKRAKSIERGLMALKNALTNIKERDSFYVIAVKYFEEAISLYAEDYFSLYRLGYIYLKWDGHVDLGLAEKNFKESAKYAVAELNAKGLNVNNIAYNKKAEGTLLEASEAYIYAAKACYLQGKIPEAIKLAEEAWRICPILYKAGFDYCRYLAANNQFKEAAMIVKGVIKKANHFYNDVKEDDILKSNVAIVKILKQLEDEALVEAKEEYDSCRVVVSNTARTYMDLIKRKIAQNTYCEAREAINMLQKIDFWQVDHGARIKDGVVLAEEPSVIEFYGTFIDFSKFEMESVAAIPVATALSKNISLEKEMRLLQKELDAVSKEVNKHDEEHNLYVYSVKFTVFVGVIPSLIVAFFLEKILPTWLVLIPLVLFLGRILGDIIPPDQSERENAHAEKKALEDKMDRINREIETTRKMTMITNIGAIAK